MRQLTVRLRKKRTTQTTTVTHEVMVTRRARIEISVWCPECAEQVRLVTLAEAVKMTGVSSRVLYRLIEEGRIHFAETADSVAMICPATFTQAHVERR